MRTALFVCFGIFCSFLLLPQAALAQIKLPSGMQMPGGGGGGSRAGGGGAAGGTAILDDSTKTIYGPKTTVHFFENDILNNRDSVRHIVDTTLTNFHRWTPVDLSWGKLVDLGNVATASRNLLFSPREDIGTQFGYRAYDAYAIKADEVKYIDTRSQHTELSYVSGGRKISLGRFAYSQNVNPRFNFGLRAQRLTSNKQYGVYSSLNSESLLGQNWTALIHTSFFSKDKKYLILAHYRHLNQKVREQGGVLKDTIDGVIDPYPYEGSAKISDDANSWERRHGFHIYQQYRLANGFQVFQQADYQSVINRFTDNLIARGLEKGIYPAPRYDSLHTRQDTYFKVFDNKIGLKGNYKGFNYRAYLRNRLYGQRSESQVTNTTGLPYTRYRTGLKFDNILGLWLGYYLKDSAQYLTAEGEVNMVQSEFKLKGELNTKWGKAGFQSIQTNPDLLVQRYINNHFEWRNSFNPTKVQTLYASLPLKTRRINFVPEIQIHQVNDYIYFDTASLPRQLHTGFRLLRLGFTSDVKLKRWGFAAMGYMTLNDNKDVIRIPTYFASGEATFDFVYSKVLFVQAGLAARYRSSYFADAYMPVTQQFHLQNDTRLAQALVVDAFANIRITRVRLFVKMSYINMGGNFGLFPKGYYVTPTYLGLRRSLSFGVNWPLFD